MCFILCMHVHGNFRLLKSVVLNFFIFLIVSYKHFAISWKMCSCPLVVVVGIKTRCICNNWAEKWKKLNSYHENKCAEVYVRTCIMSEHMDMVLHAHLLVTPNQINLCSQSIFNSDQFRNTIEEEIEKWCEEVCVQSCYNNSYRTLFPSLYYLLLTLKYRYLQTYNYYLPISLYVQTISVKHLGFQLPLVMSFFFRGSMYRYLCTFTSIISL